LRRTGQTADRSACRSADKQTGYRRAEQRPGNQPCSRANTAARCDTVTCVCSTGREKQCHSGYADNGSRTHEWISSTSTRSHFMATLSQSNNPICFALRQSVSFSRRIESRTCSKWIEIARGAVPSDEEDSVMKGILLWAIGIPIPVIILLYLFHVI
jgi:hypothetical protein